MAATQCAAEGDDMKTKQIITLVVGITTMMLAPLAGADARGGGGGGGGFHGGGGGHFAGGGVARGGGTSFGAARGGFGGPRFSVPAGHFSNIRPGHSFSSAAMQQSRVRQPVVAATNRSSAAQPAHTTATLNRRQERGTTPNIARNGVMPQGARSAQTSARGALNGRTDHIAERHDGNWHRDWDHRHAHFHNGHFFVFDNGYWFGLDDGFFPWDYLPYYADDYYPYDYYADVQQSDDTTAAYNDTPTPDPTVQAAQAQLNKEGYYGGPADGIFGPSTRDAVARYQMANQLNVTGSLSPDTLQALQLPQGSQG